MVPEVAATRCRNATRPPTAESARRPVHVAAAQQVHVQVRHRLTGLLPAVDNQPIAVLEAQLLRASRTATRCR